MESIKLLDYLPAIAVLISVVGILLVLIKSDIDFLGKKINGTLLVSLFMFLIILIVHLFKEQNWTADLLKILIGTSLGAGSIKRKYSGNNNGMISNHAERDLIANMLGNINTNTQITKKYLEEYNTDQGGKIDNVAIRVIGGTCSGGKSEEMEKEINDQVKELYKEGWQLKNVFPFSYNDGIVLIFIKKNNDG